MRRTFDSLTARSCRKCDLRVTGEKGLLDMAAKKTTARGDVTARGGKTVAKAPAKGATKRAAKKATPAAGPAKKTAVKKVAAAKTAVKTTPAKKAPAKKVAKKVAPAKKAPVKKAPAKKAPAKKAVASAPAATSAAKASPAKKVAKNVAKSPAKAPAAKKAPGKLGSQALAVRAGEKPWTAREIAEIKTMLESDQQRLEDEIDAVEEEIDHLLREGGEGAGHDQADVGSNTFERDHEMSMAKNARDNLVLVRDALVRVEDGSYGICESCGQPIGKMRLQAFPRATLCMECKQRQERR